jgi:putative ABC transport system permease protein
MGVNNINVNLRETSGQRGGFGGPGASFSDENLITPDMLETLAEWYPLDIAAISLTQNAGQGTAKDGELYANVTLQGVNPGYMEAQSPEMLDGRFIAERDLEGRKSVAVVTDKLAEKLFGGTEAALGKTVKIHTERQIMSFYVVGVYAYEASGFSGTESEEDLRTSMLIPVTTAKRISRSGDNYQSFTVVSSQESDSAALAAEIERYFLKYYPEDGKYAVSANSMESLLSTMTDMLSTVQTAIAAIAAISLLVGGIGVMNIMLVSVTERTREIGTRKALGARNSAIRTQFIVESMIICLIGGVIGIGLGLALGAIGARLLDSAASASVPAIILAVAFSMAIGVFFGYYPANKAAKLDPIEALRYE